MESIKIALQWLCENWVTILAIATAIGGIIVQTKKFFEKSKEEQLEIAKAQIKEVILKFIAEAEVDYQEWHKAGSIKRAQVIEKVYSEYPILSKVANQTAVVVWLDEVIDETLITLRDVIKNNVETLDEKEEIKK